MGVREMRAYLAVMNEHRTEPEPTPDRWDDASEQNFADLRAERDKMRGR